ncbi:Squalene monooxygenase-like protein [Emericellopsis cladophorae]|uniref:Squalene monooxygenase n=1 Tax=Emericellopsis cladophorae TaxID=2686198 RepID=A0A9Q0BI58_9HYPO|nr:Squalene monooxygenase-like protein [Emericellopsis cladophorae]KAI6785209.1 Squalene monooxygenase-like protein [Emericellopsis cladophorae]
MDDTVERNRLRREQAHEADVVVVGAGIFGCAISYALAKQGRSVILLERWMHQPDRIVGELLQPGGVAALKKLGLGHCLEDIDAIPCKGYTVLYHGVPTKISYPTIDDDGQVIHQWGGSGREGKRPVGRAFHHGRFIMQLRRACVAHPNITVVETEVTSTIRSEVSDEVLGVETRTTNKETGEKTRDCFFGQLNIIADGYASKFRKGVLDATPVVRSKFYALELIDCPLPEPFHALVVIGNAFPVLLYQIGSRETRALIDVPADIPEASPAAGGVRGYINNCVLPAVPEPIRSAMVTALADGKIPRSMPNSWLPPSKQSTDGLILLGDAMNMRHPLTGGGMTVAFNDAVMLSDLLHPSQVPSLSDSQAVRSAMDTLYWKRKRLTGIVNVLAQALYALFAANDTQLRALQRGCFGYFERGMTDAPAGLLGAILQRPVVLAYHFFSVAFLAIWMNACDVVGSIWGIWKAPLALIDMVLILWKACVVFVPVMWREACR